MFGSIATTSARTLSRTAGPTASLLRRFTSTSLLRNTSTAAPSAEEPATAGELKIREILKQRFQPSVLKVQDVSGGCGSFYAIELSSKEFKGMPTVKAHRMVNSELKHVIKDIHGLQLRTVAED
ncbi:related to AIM1-cytoplasmic protein involved in mitochondrial function or organization [Ustilago bromivora]|uniref:Related to AIM1 \|nr:related to AIM1-cytoplasmic protein involved in mitochondrial function or organization [Ustilago bromivora]SYW80146.1 related to AIM1 \